MMWEMTTALESKLFNLLPFSPSRLPEKVVPHIRRR